MKPRLIGYLVALCYRVNGFASLQRPTVGVVPKPPIVDARLFMVTPPANIAPADHRKPVAFKHLFRHYDDICMDCWLRCAEPLSFLKSCGYTKEEIDSMAQEWPDLSTKDVHNHLAPHIRFLVKTLQGGTGDLLWEDDARIPGEEECALPHGDDVDADEQHQLKVSELAKRVIPVDFFNLRLEKTLAPWHAYLSWQAGLPSGRVLLEDNGEFLRHLLEACDTSKIDNFVSLCNAWETTGKQHTLQEILEFVRAFQEGLVPAVRNNLHSNTVCDPGQMVELLLSHGANHLEDDHHGASLLHWAAGTGNYRAVKALLQARQDDGIPPEEIIVTNHVAKDGATPLHWAASGVTPHGVFGTGGHVEICQLLLDLAGPDLTSVTTYTQNSPLEWAAWAGSLDVVRLLVEDYGADPHFCSDNGNAAHWACAGGSLPVCEYLAESCRVDFCMENASKGWTPLDLAKSEGHSNVAEWLVQRFDLKNDSANKNARIGLLETDIDRQDLFKEVSEAIQKESIQKVQDDMMK